MFTIMLLTHAALIQRRHSDIGFKPFSLYLFVFFLKLIEMIGIYWPNTGLVLYFTLVLVVLLPFEYVRIRSCRTLGVRTWT
jgi:hypothetical protein